MLEEVINPFFLNEPADKFKIGFLILNTEAAFAIGINKGKTEAVRGDARLLQERFDDILCGCFLEDAAIPAQR